MKVNMVNLDLEEQLLMPFFIVRQIIKKVKEQRVYLYFHFIDFKTAFETVWTTALWKMSIGITNKSYDNTE